ncbi:MAG: histidinol-phosphate transaminase [Clostridia bacterium]|nr:histidinol-phosphate transaminase [Clostridia bacterium]
MSRYVSKRLSRIEAYTPGEQPQDKKYIKLNTNESPYPASPKVVEAVSADAVARLRLYCDPECKKLTQALAGLYGVGEKNIFLSNGSDDILNFAFMAYGESGVAYADITYGFYPVFAELHGITPTVIPLKEDFSLDVEGFKNQNKLVVIANPNAPTGMEISLSDIESIVLSNPNSVVVIDEAYVDFGGTSAIPLTKKYDNLLVCQTYSKSRSMAGARLGYAVGNEALIADLNKIKYSTNPYNVNTLTQLAGVAAVEDNDYYLGNAQKIIATRVYVIGALEQLGFEVLPSKANFIFARSPKISGLELYLKLKERGVLIRHFEKARIKDFNRITIGSQQEMEIFISKVTEILGE